MFVELILLVAAGDTVLALSRDNICQEEKRYTINVTEYFLRNSTVRNYEWCLNVPPRCSFYTTRLINDSRIIEKEVIDLIDKCCSGYTEDKDGNRCVPVCPDCDNGTCVDGKCLCFPGFKGDQCNINCDSSHWGENCKFLCDCNGNSCHPKTGVCICPPGTTGKKCHLPCSSGFYGLDCKQRCDCDLDVPCDPTDGQCKLSTPPTKIQFTNNGKFEIDRSVIVFTDSTTTETTISFFENENESKYHQMSINNYIDNNRLQSSTSSSVQVMKSKAKVKSKEVTVTNDEDNYLKDDAYRGNPEVNRNDLVSSASAATAISVGIIIVAGVIVATNHLKKIKANKEKREKSNGVSTVAVYTRSIFHTPLPEPPPFENPVFVSPLEANSSNEGRFETHVVCSMNFPSHSSGKDYLYDHPPSTGSYRAASIPEPPDIDSNIIHLEPVYDEIPLGLMPTSTTQPPLSYQPSDVYMNTTGRTRF